MPGPNQLDANKTGSALQSLKQKNTVIQFGLYFHTAVRLAVRPPIANVVAASRICGVGCSATFGAGLDAGLTCHPRPPEQYRHYGDILAHAFGGGDSLQRPSVRPKKTVLRPQRTFNLSAGAAGEEQRERQPGCNHARTGACCAVTFPASWAMTYDVVATKFW